jgi:proline iminopeptidase
VLFTGEMVYPWMFEDIAVLRPYKAAADLLAAKSDWGRLYDVDALRQHATMPVASATYVEVSTSTAGCRV